MSGTAQAALREAIAAALRAHAPLSGVAVASKRRRPMAQQVNRQITVDLEQSPADTRAVIGLTEWHTRYRISCMARDVAGVVGEDGADQLVAAAFACLTVPGAIDNAVMEVRPIAIVWAEDEVDNTLAAAHLVLELHHRTSATSITV